MICKKCNTLNSNDAKVCINCGQKLGVTVPPPPKSPGGAAPSLNRTASSPKPSASVPPKSGMPGGDEKKRSFLWILLIVLLLIIVGAGYFYVNTDLGQNTVEDLKKNQYVGEYIALADSVLKANFSEFVPRWKTEAEAKKLAELKEIARLDSIAFADSVAAAEALKKKSSKKTSSGGVVEQVPKYKRIKRNMQYYKALKDNMNMVLIPAGPVTMGSDMESENEKPVHLVSVKEFYIDEHEVTNAQFRIFVEETGYKLPKFILFDRFSGPSQPIVGISFEDAEAYAKWAGKKLPTEAQWERAARGGQSNLKYPYSNDIDPNMACYDLNPELDGPADVKSYEPNDYKLYDMDGNVSEWTSSSALPYPGGKLVMEYGQDYKVIRGGSWKDIKSSLTVSKRDFKGKKWTGNGTGFRCVMDY
jgi:formylglycine-generating enzyme required for sulfatase activity